MNSQNKTTRRKWWLAGLFSYLVPGLGQIYNAQPVKAFFMYLVTSIFGSAFFAWSLDTMKDDLLHSRLSLLFTGLILYFLIQLCVILDAIFRARRHKSIEKARYDRWYVYVIIILISISVDFMSQETTRNLLLKPYKIPTASMSPTLEVGDYFLSNKLYYCTSTPQRGDIAIFRQPFDDNTEFVKRIIGLPGDTLEIRNRQVYINNQPIQEPYLSQKRYNVNPEITAKLSNYGPKVIPQNQYFLLGDNRDNSLDSREWGTVDRSRILGKASVIYFSIGSEFPYVRWGRLGIKI